MRLFVKGAAPSALKVLIFIFECDRMIETEEVADISSPEFLRMNPFGTVPVLATDAGEFISESLTICRYLDELWDRPGLFGRESRDRLQIEQWERRAELLLFVPGIEYVHHTHPMFATLLDQQPAYVALAADRSRRALQVFEDRLRDSRYLAGEIFSMADITAFLGVGSFTAFGGFDLPTTGPLRRWNDEVSARPSMRILERIAAQMTAPASA